ncbi:MAG TPA: cupredoxin domain-containing protein [Actinomycetota bacterium]|jgi:plastocyanin|nr:cupredoxin domain-containing protein [Actinomycetota bacterium]
MRNLRLVGALVGMLTLAAAGCGGGDSGGSGGGSATTAAAGATTAATGGGAGEEIKLTAKGIKWDTTTLDLKSGTSYTVEVTNGDSVEHNFTFRQAGANTDIEGGEDAKVIFTAPAAGSYEFHCKYHPSAMKGTVTVT